MKRIEILNDMQEPQKTLALGNRNIEKDLDECVSFSEALRGAFDYENSLEGLQFWNTVEFLEELRISLKNFKL